MEPLGGTFQPPGVGAEPWLWPWLGRLCCHPCPRGLIRMQVLQAQQSRSPVIGEQRERVWALADSPGTSPTDPCWPWPSAEGSCHAWPHLCALLHPLFPFLSGLSFSNPPDSSPCPGGSALVDSPSTLTPWKTSRSDLNPSSPIPLTPSPLLLSSVTLDKLLNLSESQFTNLQNWVIDSSL